jgi:hypothetical protein
MLNEMMMSEIIAPALAGAAHAGEGAAHPALYVFAHGLYETYLDRASDVRVRTDRFGSMLEASIC